MEQAIAGFGPSHIVVALDARDGLVRTRGWQQDGGVSALDLGKRVAACGVSTVIHTDISRDGVLSGVNARASAELARQTGLSVIASGGVASLEDVRRALEAAPHGVSGLITGRALYDGALNLGEALALVAGASAQQPESRSGPC